MSPSIALALVLAAGLLPGLTPCGPNQGQDPVPSPETPAGVLSEPDFDAYFPDDPDGGARLDARFTDRSAPPLTDEEFIALVRRGLRRTTTRKLFILREFGNRFVWGKRPQNPEAVELMFHAADPRPSADGYGTRHSAVYFGLSVVRPKPPRILRALAAIAMAEDSADTIGRIAWGASDQIEALIECLAPYAASDDPAVRAKAVEMEAVFRGEESAQQWWRRHAIETARAEYEDEIPDLRLALREGDSAARRAALARIRTTNLMLIVPAEALPDFEAAAADADPKVREAAMTTVGQHWIWSAAEQLPGAIEMALRVSRDPVEDVRADAVYFGLSTVRDPGRAVVERMLDMLAAESEWNMTSRLRWGLQSHDALVREILMERLEGDDPERQISAFRLYASLLQESPPVRPSGTSVPADLVGTWSIETVDPRGARMSASLEIRQEDGGLRLRYVGQPSSDSPLVVVQHDAAVAAAARLDGFGGDTAMITLRLEGGSLTGSLFIPDAGVLVPLSGTRR